MFDRVSPESMGVRSEGIVRFLDDMKQKHLHMHAMMILRRGKVIAEASFAPWDAGDLHILFSLSKSFTSTAVGFAVQDGLLKLSDRLVDFFPEYLPAAPCENMSRITVRDLITMNTGHQDEPMREGRWEKTFLRTYVEHVPGTHFLYNTYGTFMLSAIIQKVTGRKLLDYLREKLMDPLGMSPDIWTEESPEGVATGGYGLNARVEDIAKLGQFYLQMGKWEGRQLLDENWIRDAQKPWSDNSAHGGKDSDWGSGYGYQFWMCRPEHVYRGDGAFGQYCIVMPDQEMVIAITSGVEDMAAVLDSIWRNILPAVGEPCGESSALKKRPGKPVTPAQWEDDGRDASPPVLEDGWLGRYTLQPGMMDISEITFREGEVALTCYGRETTVPLVMDTWQACCLSGETKRDAAHYCTNAALRAARDGDTLILHWCYTNTPFEDVMEIDFTPHGLTLRCRRNVGFGENHAITVLGRRETDR